MFQTMQQRDNGNILIVISANTAGKGGSLWFSVSVSQAMNCDLSSACSFSWPSSCCSLSFSSSSPCHTRHGYLSIYLPSSSSSSPWYNRHGWMGVKIQLAVFFFAVIYNHHGWLRVENQLSVFLFNPEAGVYGSVLIDEKMWLWKCADESVD